MSTASALLEGGARDGSDSPRHERLSVAILLSEKKHHTSRGQRKDRAGEWVRDLLHGEVPVPCGHRSGSSSTLWSSSPTSCPWFRFWTFLCRRWWTSWWLRSCTLIRRFPSRSPKCPRSRRHPVVLARCRGRRRQRSSWWKVPTVVSFSSLQQQIAEQINDIPVPRRGVQAVAVFKVTTQDKVAVVSSS